MPKRPKHRRRSTYPEPGAWILDDRHGLPRASPPEPLPRGRKLSNREVELQVAYEGLGYCIFEHISAQRIADPTLAKLWEETRSAMAEIVGYLENAPMPTERVKVGRQIS